MCIRDRICTDTCVCIFWLEHMEHCNGTAVQVMCTPDDPVHSSNSCACLAGWVQVILCTLSSVQRQCFWWYPCCKLGWNLSSHSICASIMMALHYCIVFILAPSAGVKLYNGKAAMLSSVLIYIECILWSMSQPNRHLSQCHKVSACIAPGCLEGWHPSDLDIFAGTSQFRLPWLLSICSRRQLHSSGSS